MVINTKSSSVRSMVCCEPFFVNNLSNYFFTIGVVDNVLDVHTVVNAYTVILQDTLANWQIMLSHTGFVLGKASKL